MKKKIIGVAKKSAWIMVIKVVIFTAVFLVLAFLTNVPTGLDDADRSVFKNELDLNALQNPQTFADEINTIRIIQHRVFQKAPLGAGIPDFSPREPSNLMKAHEGLCFDRSRTLDKAFDYIGLPSRHVYLSQIIH